MVTNSDTELSDPKNWSVEDEVNLLYSTLDNKPVGIDKHFQMSIIWTKFTSYSGKIVSSDVLWRKLNSLYNLKSLDKSEILPFNVDEEDFKLPSEILNNHQLKNISEDEKRNVDFNGIHKKYVSVNDTDDDNDIKSQGKLKGNEKMKWFESPQCSRINDKSTKKYGKSKIK